MTQFWSRQGEPMELMEWAMAYEDAAIRCVAIDSDGPDRPMVSTIWEGMSRPLTLHEQPFPMGIFETALVADGRVESHVRSTTEEEALEVHAEWCRVVLGREPRPEDGLLQIAIDRYNAAREQ